MKVFKVIDVASGATLLTPKHKALAIFDTEAEAQTFVEQWPDNSPLCIKPVLVTDLDFVDGVLLDARNFIDEHSIDLEKCCGERVTEILAQLDIVIGNGV